MMKTFYKLLVVVFIFSACKPSANNQQEKYNEQYRSKIHFSPETGWANDPNGMVYYDGEYHLFFQHNPDTTIWGPMHWGHAVSKDLIHWEQLPIALYPDSLGWIFSGNAVIDWENTSGLGKNGVPPMVGLFLPIIIGSWKTPGRISFSIRELHIALIKGVAGQNMKITRFYLIPEFVIFVTQK
jgi:fructan beta-fructosidase